MPFALSPNKKMATLIRGRVAPACACPPRPARSAPPPARPRRRRQARPPPHALGVTDQASAGTATSSSESTSPSPPPPSSSPPPPTSAWPPPPPAVPPPIAVDIEAAPSNGRRLYATTDIAAPAFVVWAALTDYDRLGEFVPGLAENRCLARTAGGCTLLQVGQQSLALGLSFKARVVLDIQEHTAACPEPRTVGVSVGGAGGGGGGGGGSGGGSSGADPAPLRRGTYPQPRSGLASTPTRDISFAQVEGGSGVPGGSGACRSCGAGKGRRGAAAAVRRRPLPPRPPGPRTRLLRALRAPRPLAARPPGGQAGGRRRGRQPGGRAQARRTKVAGRVRWGWECQFFVSGWAFFNTHTHTLSLPAVPRPGGVRARAGARVTHTRSHERRRGLFLYSKVAAAQWPSPTRPWTSWKPGRSSCSGRGRCPC